MLFQNENLNKWQQIKFNMYIQVNNYFDTNQKM
jgi:hypothetical protein